MTHTGEDVAMSLEASERAREWETHKDITCVECPDCAFLFAAYHEGVGGGYSCPCCTEVAYDKAAAYVVDRLEAWMDGEKAMLTAAERRGDRHAAEGHYNTLANYMRAANRLRAILEGRP